MFILSCNSFIPFHAFNYRLNSHHYFIDPRVQGRPFDFLIALGQWDAQWYLKIAETGYPTGEQIANYHDPHTMGGLTYAFFPLYPIVFYLFNLVFKDISVTAFIVTLVLLVVNFTSLYFIISKLYTVKIALRAIFLLYLFPFSIFYRSYFTEGLFLLLLVWFSYFLLYKKWFAATVMFALLAVTRPNGLFLFAVLAFSFYRAIRRRELKLWRALSYILQSLIPFGMWLLFCYLRTGNPLYWVQVEYAWFQSRNIFYPLYHNALVIISFWHLPLHSFHASKLDSVTVITTMFLLIISRKFLKPQLWWISFLIWIVPLVTKDTMSFTRYQIVSFPLFIYLSAKLNPVTFFAVCGIFLVLLFLTSLYFVNWYWLG